MKRAILALIITAAVSGGARAKGPGTTSANFLKIGVGPRPVAMGESFAGLADDINAIAYNPAGLATLSRSEASFMHNEFFEGVKQEWLAYAHPSSLGTFAAGLNTVSVSEFDGFDNTGAAAGKVSSSDLSFTAAYAKDLKSLELPVNLGASVKYLSSRLDSERASAVALDLGGTYNVDESLRLGASVLNMGSKMKYMQESFALPLMGKLGASKKLPLGKMGLIVAADGTFSNDRSPTGSLGVEFSPLSMLALRVGYRNNQDAGAGVSAGVGFKMLQGAGTPEWLPELGLDYAFVDFGALEQTHRFSLSMRFGKGG
jgi:long-subunit fatty acid transport protein